MTNYNNGKVYMIKPKVEHEPHEVYIGSTTNEYLSQRFVWHRGDYKQFKAGKGKNISVYALFDKYGINNCEIILLENVNANSKDELRARERYYFDNIKNINNCRPFITKNERLESLRQYCHQYYDNYKDTILKRQQQYYINNKDNIELRVSRKVVCICGCCVRRDSIYKHQKSKIHKSIISLIYRNQPLPEQQELF